MPPDPIGLERQLVGILGRPALLSGEGAAPYAVGGLVPSLVARPGTQEEAAAVLSACATAGAAVAPRGSGSALGLGNPPARLDVVLCLDRLDRVVEFDAANLTVTAEAGVRLGDLRQLVAAERELLPLDPARLERRTVGGLIATNGSGPCRLLHGTARDLLLGLSVALPGGERIRCGGTVIKNVSGYDLTKLFIGSLGTLGVITQATFKLLPAPATRAAVLGIFPAPAQAADVIGEALGSYLLPESMELLSPRALAAAAGELGGAGSAGYGLAVSLAGSPETVARQLRDFTRLFRDGRAERTTLLTPEQRGPAGQAIRDVLDRALDPAGARVAVKIGVPLRRTVDLLAAAEALGARAGWLAAAAAHAGSGVVRAVFAVEGAEAAAVRAGIESLRREAEAAEGSLVVEGAPAEVARGLDAWGSPGEALPAMRRLKAEFDPGGILNPGRFLGGI